ncbi:MAG: hypothetical protein ACLPM3_12715 [Terracidiphilus sp.]
MSRARRIGHAAVALLAWALLLTAFPAWAGTAEASASPELPDAPQPQTSAAAPATAPCPAGSAAKPAAANALPASTAGTAPPATSAQPATQPAAGTQSAPCPPRPEKNWYQRFLNGPEVKPMTPKEKAHLAARNVLDPFNALTILGSSAIAVGSDADSPYGPGMKGFGRYVGVSYTQDITGEFFGTFLIPSIVHQDPHYHRMPNATIPRRIRHAITQVVWTQGDNGKGMVNYGAVVGLAIDSEISDLYVPGQQTNLPSTAERYSTGLGAAPIDNFVTEFLPDVARRIHVRVVLFQQIINQVAKTPGTGSP